jgi:hypothetical protein
MSFRASPCYILLLIQSYVSVGPFSEERERLYSSDEEDWLQMGIDAHQSQYKCEQSINLPVLILGVFIFLCMLQSPIVLHCCDGSQSFLLSVAICLCINVCLMDKI